VSPAPSAPSAATGIPGLDDVLAGGLPRNRIHLLEGDPGSGKTTASLQFLIEGARLGESVLYVSLSETTDEVRAAAASHGWTLDGVEIYELGTAEDPAEGDYTLFHPAEVELNKATQGLLETVARVKPTRVVFDSLTEMRLLARDPLRYRRQVMTLKQFFSGRQCTVWMLDDRTAEPADLQLESVAHSVVLLQQLAPEYGAERRRLRAKKVRGVAFRGGYHDFRITTGGLVVYPRLIAAEHHVEFGNELVPSGIPALDALLGGGLNRGTSTLIAGPAGSGKSSIALRYALTAAEAGHDAAVYLFEEGLATVLMRARGLGWDVDTHRRSGKLTIEQIDPAELSPGEFSDRVRQAAGDRKARVIVIDSLNGYLTAMPNEQHLSLHLHELLMYLNQLGVASFLVMAQHGVVASELRAPVEVSYVADTVLQLRYFESTGAIRVAAAVVKKRTGIHERTIRELRIGSQGVWVGEPLIEFQGVLTGVPVHTGTTESLSGPSPQSKPGD
jgi:circadian clock protein KaiC